MLIAAVEERYRDAGIVLSSSYNYDIFLMVDKKCKVDDIEAIAWY